MNDYERIATVIRYIDREYRNTPDYKELASHLGISEYHFHRLFSRFASVTPKTFLRCLTVEHAREILRSGADVMETTLDLGLSSPGRLHDLCVHLEAASPGEIQSGGKGWTIRYGIADSPFGQVLIADSPRGICHLSFIDEPVDYVEKLSVDWSEADIIRDDRHALSLSGLIFYENPDQGQNRPIKALVRGTAMQIKVWRALVKIPSGSLMSYGKLAEAVGHPGAARAAGSAVGANAVAYLIPCHRVIRETGAIGGYRWGELRKRILIARETASGEDGSDSESA